MRSQSTPRKDEVRGSFGRQRSALKEFLVINYVTENMQIYRTSKECKSDKAQDTYKLQRISHGNQSLCDSLTSGT
jgi:hypothetical protein